MVTTALLPLLSLPLLAPPGLAGPDAPASPGVELPAVNAAMAVFDAMPGAGAGSAGGFPALLSIAGTVATRRATPPSSALRPAATGVPGAYPLPGAAIPLEARASTAATGATLPMASALVARAAPPARPDSSALPGGGAANSAAQQAAPRRMAPPTPATTPAAQGARAGFLGAATAVREGMCRAVAAETGAELVADSATLQAFNPLAPGQATAAAPRPTPDVSDLPLETPTETAPSAPPLPVLMLPLPLLPVLPAIAAAGPPLSADSSTVAPLPVMAEKVALHGLATRGSSPPPGPEGVMNPPMPAIAKMSAPVGAVQMPVAAMFAVVPTERIAGQMQFEPARVGAIPPAIRYQSIAAAGADPAPRAADATVAAGARAAFIAAPSSAPAFLPPGGASALVAAPVAEPLASPVASRGGPPAPSLPTPLSLPAGPAANVNGPVSVVGTTAPTPVRPLRAPIAGAADRPGRGIDQPNEPGLALPGITSDPLLRPVFVRDAASVARTATVPVPPPDMVVATDRLGDVRVSVEGTARDLTVALTINPVTALAAADVERLAQRLTEGLTADLAAAGVRLQALHLSGTTPTATADTGLGNGTAGDTGRGGSPNAQREAPNPNREAPNPHRDAPYALPLAAADPRRSPRSDRYA